MAQFRRSEFWSNGDEIGLIERDERAEVLFSDVEAFEKESLTGKFADDFANAAALDGLLANLSGREGAAIRARAGIGGAELSVAELAEAWNITRERVYQIERRAMRKLVHRAWRTGLTDVVPNGIAIGRSYVEQESDEQAKQASEREAERLEAERRRAICEAIASSEREALTLEEKLVVDVHVDKSVSAPKPQLGYLWGTSLSRAQRQAVREFLVA